MVTLFSELTPRKQSLFGSLLGLLVRVPRLSFDECLCLILFTISTGGTATQLNSSSVLCP